MAHAHSFSGGRCAGMTPVQLDYALGSRQSAQALCDGCPLQAYCIATALVSSDRYSRMGGLTVRERQFLSKQLKSDIGVTRVRDLRQTMQWLQTHPQAITTARLQADEHSRLYKRSQRHRRYVREYLENTDTLTNLAKQQPIVAKPHQQ